MFESMRSVSPMPFILAVMLVVGINDSRAEAPANQYLIANGIVSDTKSGLEWEQNPPNTLQTWNQATSRCQSLQLMGTGWRLPSMKELQTIVDETRLDPAIDVTAFPDTALDKYWSSTVRAAYPNDAWLVVFDDGQTSRENFGMTFPSRCVR